MLNNIISDKKNGHLSLVPQSVKENTAVALKPFDSFKSISLNEAKRFLSDNIDRFLKGESVSIPELCAVENAFIKAKRTAISNSNEGFARELDEKLIRAYTVMGFLLPVLEYEKYFNYTYYEYELSDITKKLIDELEKRYGKIIDSNGAVIYQNYSKKANEVNENFKNYGHHWGTIANYAGAHALNGNSDEAFNLLFKAEQLINVQYSEVDKRTNQILCYPEYAQGYLKLISVLDNTDKNAFELSNSDIKENSKKAFNMDDLKIAEKIFAELQRIGYSTPDFLNSLGVVQEKKHNYREELLYYADSIEANPNNIEPWENSFYVFLNHNNFEKALLILDHISLISPESDEFLNAADAYKKVTGVEIAPKIYTSSDTENLPDAQEIADNYEKCLQIIKDTSWLKTHQLQAQKEIEAGEFIQKAYDILDLAVKNVSIEDFLTAEELLVKSVGIQVFSETHIAFFKLYFESNSYELCREAYENTSYKSRKMIPADKLERVNYYMENPSEYIIEAQKSLKTFDGSWFAYSTLGHAYKLAAIKEEDSQVKAELINKAYFNYVEAERKLEDVLNDEESILFKGNASQDVLTPYMCRPFFGQGYAKFMEYQQGLKSETELELCKLEAVNKLGELYDMEYENSDLSYALGAISHADGDIETAIEYLEESIMLNPKNINSLIEIAEIYLQEIGVKAAAHYLLEAAEIDPQNKRLLSLIEEFKIDLSKLV